MEAAIIGGLTGAAFGAIGASEVLGSTGKVIGHAAVGCASSAASGGSCAVGALSAGVAKLATVSNVLPIDPVGGTIAAAVVGGTVSELGGGNFANGAITASFGYMFNHLVSVGMSGRLPLIGGGSAAFGVSWHEGKFDAGFVFQGDVPGLSYGRMLAGYRLWEFGYQPGEFDSIRGTTQQQVQAQWGPLWRQCFGRCESELFWCHSYIHRSRLRCKRYGNAYTNNLRRAGLPRSNMAYRGQSAAVLWRQQMIVFGRKWN